MAENKRPITYLIWCRGLGYLHETGTCWTDIDFAMRFDNSADAEIAAFKAALREPHLIGEIQATSCCVDHWNRPKT